MKQIDRFFGVSRIEVGSAEVRRHVGVLIIQGYRLFIPADGQIEAAHVVVGISQSSPSLDIIFVFSRTLLQRLELINELRRRVIFGKSGLTLLREALSGGDTRDGLDDTLAYEKADHKSNQTPYDGGGDLLVFHFWPYVNIA